MDLVREFGLIDAIDVLIVAYVIYRLLLLIRRTRAVRMAVGLVLLGAFFFLADAIGLTTVTWALGGAFGYIVFAIIVLFQNEIRRVLTTLGRTPFFRTFSRSEQRDPVADVATAATALASRRRGAIMVLEREMSLRNYVEAGITLDAALSYDLLVTLFNPEDPLHDGAVIIQGGRIAAASCFLPLTLNPRLSRDLGSRHRAAIGISEETDAVAVVVSEETGTISVVEDGRIRRKLDAATLTQRLKELLAPPEPEEEPEEKPSEDRGQAGDVAPEKATEGVSK